MRRVRRKGGNKEKVFGCDLLEHLNASSQEIPLVLKCCSEFVETHGIVDGIYRLSGVSSNIQKLRGEFESDGTPDLNKDLYLQDIHCVSSLCKAYFRELPNPLLTYQLYDKFAEAVAIQLEEERLVKIRDVLKELPRPHYRTLEFLMRHLVRMASYSSETNMHARNLAIVWAPNLLRSKDIEASGFNGTAAFMEVRVQSIVVEFILTHVPQLFPEQGVSNERRNSLPSPSAVPNQEEVFFRSAAHQPVPNFGNISPGDGPLAMRPYHAIIEGTDKRKGSLKGRKWMSIFNIGGRFQDPRRRHKNSAKEKDRTSLRPARSMDSLSSPSFPNEGSRRSGPRPPSTTPLVTPSPQPGSDTPVPSGAIGGSEYAVTFRRGTGLVSGGAGTQGTYTALDPEGLGVTGNETLQSRSPGLSSKVGRRAAMHITGPTMVTVPLHITSNLAQGVLQGGGGDRVIHRGRDKDKGDKVEGKEGGEKESRGMEWKVEEVTKVEEEEKNLRGKEMDSCVVAAEEGRVAGAGGEDRGEEEEREKKKEEEEKEEQEVRDKLVSVSREQRAKSVNSSNEGDKNEDAVGDDQSEYMDMKGMNPANVEQEVTECADDRVFDDSEILNSTEVEGDDLGLSGYVEDNFEFLDQMDCSVMDHMDCSVSYQVNEFSVEPPGHSDDEYEVMAQAAEPAELQMHLQPGKDAHNLSLTESKPRRPLSLDIHSRHSKSLSLPHMTSPVQGPEEFSSEDEAMVEDSEDIDYSSDDEDECMFVKSLPSDFFLKLTDSEVDSDPQDCCTVNKAPVSLSQSSEEEEGRSQTPDPPACKESAAGEQTQVEEDKEALNEKETTETVEENHQERDPPENNRQSKVMEEEDSVMEDAQSEQEQPPAQCCTEDPPQSDDDSDSMPDKTAEREEREVADNPHGDIPHCSAVSHVIQGERADDQSEESRDFSVSEPPKTCTNEDTIESDGGEDREKPEVEDTCEGGDVEISAELADLKLEEKMQEIGKEQHSAVRRTSSELWEELGDVVCEVLEDLESKQNEENGAKGSVGRDGDGIEAVEEVGEEEEEQVAKVSGEEMGETERVGTDKTEDRTDIVEDSVETKLTDTEKEFEEKDTSLPKTSEQGEATERNDEVQHQRREEEASKKVEKERADEQDTPPSVGKKHKDIRSDVKELKEGRKCEESDSIPGGVGRKLIATKHPKVYQVKAVPVVPPKPQHCKITALTIRQQQQRERRDADLGRETPLRVQREQEKVGGGEQGRDGGDRGDGEEGRGRKEKPALRGGEKEKERERKGDGDDGAARDASRNSPLSMCFDEAVAIATMRREKEKVCEREKERHWGNETQ